MIVINTWFKLPPRKLYMWKLPIDKSEKIVRNQIDSILVNQIFRNCYIVVRIYSEADIQSDHVLLVGRFKIWMKRIISKRGKGYNLRRLKDSIVR